MGNLDPAPPAPGSLSGGRPVGDGARGVGGCLLPATWDFRFIGGITLWTLLWPSVVLWAYFTSRPRLVLGVLTLVALACLALVLLFAELTIPSPPAS